MDVPEQDREAQIIASLARSEAQLAAGETVPLEPFIERLKASIARMKAKRGAAANAPSM